MGDPNTPQNELFRPILTPFLGPLVNDSYARSRVKAAVLRMLGYCDDNTAYLTSYEELLEAEKGFGAFSIGARVGRNTSPTKGAKVFAFNTDNAARSTLGVPVN